MDIDTSTKDAIDAPLGSNGSKGSFGSDDSLEYSNDDRSTAKTSEQDKVIDKVSDKYLPPKHPSSAISIGDQHDSNLFTPKRKQTFEANADRLPGPLNLFSPGLSPIGHTNYSRYDEGDENHDVSEIESVDMGKQAEAEVRETYDTELRDSVDSLDMVSLRDDKNRSKNSLHRDLKEDNRPNYQFWKNKLFANDLVPPVSAERVSSPKIPPIVFPAADTQQHRSYIRSNSNSFDSDFNLTPRQHSLVYPTTDALYERSAAVHSPSGAELSVSIDSSSHARTGSGQQRQNQYVMYPTAKGFDGRSPHHRVNRSVDKEEAHLTMQSLLYPGTPTRHEEGTPRHHQLRQMRSPQQPMLNSPGSANGSMDSDMHVTKQSLVYPTTRAVYDKSSRPGDDDVSVDSDMHAISKQSLVYPTTAALFKRSGGASLNTTIDSDVSFAHQSYLQQRHQHSAREIPSEELNTQQVAEDQDQVGDSLGHISMLDRSLPMRTAERYPSQSQQSESGDEEGYSYRYGHFQYEYAEEDALGQSLHSISLLPASPAAPLPVHSTSSLHSARIPSVGSSHGAKRTSNLLFPPSYQHNGSSPTAASGKTPLLGSPPDSATLSRRTAAHASNSDTEFVRSATKRRDAGNSKAGNIWKEAEDLAPSNFTSLSKGNSKDTREGQLKQPVVASATAVPAAATRHLSPPSAPSSPSSVSGGSPFAGRMHTHSVGGGALMEGSLVVGALYTLQVDSHGRPAFVPVVLNSHTGNNATGVTFSSPQMHAPTGGTSHTEWKTGHHSTPQQLKEVPRYASPPGSKRLYEGSANDDTLGLSTGANSNHVDVHMVLERALHHGSLSEEKVARRWSGDTTKRNSPPAALQAPVLDQRVSHNHQQALLPTTPLRTSAQHFHSAATPASSLSFSSLNKQKKSPYRLVVGTDGQEHLQPSAEYFKERLLQRSLTSVLQSPAAGGAASGMHRGGEGLFGRLHHSPPISTFT